MTGHLEKAKKLSSPLNKTSRKTHESCIPFRGLPTILMSFMCTTHRITPPPFSSILAQKPKLRLPWCWPLRYLPTRDRPVGATFFQRITSLESAWNETSIGHWTNALSKMVLKSQQKLTDRNMLSHTTK